MSKIVFRPFEPGDRDSCVAAFLSNVPDYFAHSELDGFAKFVDDPSSLYWVLEQDGAVVGCGGYAMDPGDGVASLCWGMIHAAHHGDGLGKILMLGRIQKAMQSSDTRVIRVSTSQFTEAFFAKYGFEFQERSVDGFAEGIDLIQMRLNLTESVRSRTSDLWSHEAGRVVDFRDERHA